MIKSVLLLLALMQPTHLILADTSWMTQGQEYYNKNDYDNALDCFKRALSEDYDNSDIHYYIGMTLRSLGRYEEANTSFKRSSKLADKMRATYDSIYPSNYSFVTGSSETSDFIINFTSKKQFEDFTGRKEDYTQNENTETTLYYGVDDNESETILSWRIWWHPGVTRLPRATLMNFPIEWVADELDSKSDITIQGKKALLVKFKEEKKYQGSDKPPLVIPSSLCARYFLDKNTEVEVFAWNISKWQGNEFSNLLSTMKITAPCGWE